MEAVNLIQVYEAIWNSYKKQDYYGVITNFEKYLSFENSGLTDALMAFYAIALNQLGFYEEALKAYQIRRNFYNTEDDHMTIIHLLHRLSYVEKGKEEVEKLLSLEPNNPYYHFLYGKFCVLEAELEEAKKHFTIALNGKETKKYVLKSKQYLMRIQKHKNENAFLKVGYDTFLKQGNELEPGYIIDVKNKLQYVNKTEKNGDTKSAKRPYLIWKVEDDKVYAFQITGSINPRFDYIITPQKYCNLSTELTCKDNVCIIEKNNISSIVEKLDFHDYDNLLLYTYDEVMHTTKEEQEKRSDFLEEMQYYLKLRKQKLL